MTQEEKQLLSSGAISNKTLWDICQAGQEVSWDLSGKETTIEYFGKKVLEKLLQNDTGRKTKTTTP